MRVPHRSARRASRLPAFLVALVALPPLGGCDAGPAGAPERGPGEQRDERVVTTAPGEDFELRLGEEALVDGTDLTVAFEAVQEDSRCPSDVTCVWEGNARIVVGVRRGSDALPSLEINTALEPRSAMVPPWRIDLLELSPWPKEGVLTPEEDYVARLRVSRP